MLIPLAFTCRCRRLSSSLQESYRMSFRNRKPQQPPQPSCILHRQVAFHQVCQSRAWPLLHDSVACKEVPVDDVSIMLNIASISLLRCLSCVQSSSATCDRKDKTGRLIRPQALQVLMSLRQTVAGRGGWDGKQTSERLFIMSSTVSNV